MDPTPSEPHARLADAMKKAGLSDPALGKLADTNKQQIFKLRTGATRISPEWARRLAPHLGVEWPWLLGIDCELKTAGATDAGGAAEVRPEVPAERSGPGDGVEYRGRSYASLPVYDVAVSAGPGAFNSDHAEPEGWYLLGLEHIRRVTRARFEDLALVRVSGDSMSPTLLNDDQILVDRSVHKVGRDGMYVIATGEEVQVKRIMRDWASKTLTVASDNPAYEPSRGVQEEDIVILGRVVWISRNVGG
ncbi:XRE family transcriptional regulator [Pseudoroseomonas cervicalis]|uniref:XRE family transcriptional regulator n=1 Tax=Teichococcus cervicalis TaxID=204525 RepID=UPI0027D77B82|nr:S24 family peptidase [Pseudoroseomonas cervicalis]